MLKTTLFAAAACCLVSACIFPPSASAAINVQVTLTDGAISPRQIPAKVGEPVRVHVVNAGSKRHNLVIPDFYVFTQNLNPGESVDVTFSPDKTGSFPYYSDTGGTPEPGMRGTITVRP